MRTRWTTGSREKPASRCSSTVCPTADKARLTTIMLGYFHRQWSLSFESIIVFELPGRDPESRPCETLRCGWGHDLVAGVDRRISTASS